MIALLSDINSGIAEVMFFNFRLIGNNKIDYFNHK